MEIGELKTKSIAELTKLAKELNLAGNYLSEHIKAAVQ